MRKRHWLLGAPIVAGGLLVAIFASVRPAGPGAPRPRPSCPSTEPPKDKLDFFQSGLSRSARGEYRAAISDFDRVLEARSDWADPYYNRAVARMGLQDYAGAVEDFGQAVRLRAGWAEAHFNRALAHAATGNTKAAIADYDEALRLRNSWPEGYHNRGLARRAIGDLEGARSDFARALELAPPSWPYRAEAEKALHATRQP